MVPALGAQGLQDIPVTPAALLAGRTFRFSLSGRSQSNPRNSPAGFFPEIDPSSFQTPLPFFCSPFTFPSLFPFPGCPNSSFYPLCLKADTHIPSDPLRAFTSIVRNQSVTLSTKPAARAHGRQILRGTRVPFLHRLGEQNHGLEPKFVIKK